MKKYIILLLGFVAISACYKERPLREESTVFVEPSHMNELDKWIYDSLTVPYNIEVKWKWEDREFSNAHNVTPPQEEKARQFLKALYRIWIKPYEEEAPAGFINRYVPKLIVLSGSPQYNNDGTVSLGQAEGGRKATIFDVDGFDNLDLEKMTKAFHTMHHEFGHILNQRIAFTTDYKALSKGKYTGAWYNFTAPQANTLGFITPYSMANQDEDFVEMAATILSTVQNSNEPIMRNVPEKNEYGLVTGNIIQMPMSDFQLKLYMSGITTTQREDGRIAITQDQAAPLGLETILKKIKIVQDYYKNVWGIDIFRLQGKIEVATNNLIYDNINEEEGGE